MDGYDLHDGGLEDVEKALVVNRRGDESGPPTPFYIESEISDPNQDIFRFVRTSYEAPYLLPSNPYSFSHVISIENGSNVCTVRFDYTILKEGVYKQFESVD